MIASVARIGVFYSNNPPVAVRDTLPPTPTYRAKPVPTSGYKLSARQKAAKYDHAQMFADRLTGMTWEAIAAKHSIPGGGCVAERIMKNS